MRLALTILMLLVFIDPSFARDDDEHVLRHFKTVLWQEAYRTQDTALLDRLLHDDFVVIDDAGKVSTKAQEIAWVRENEWDPGAFEYRIERLDIYDGRFAIISGRGVAEAFSYRSTNTLVKVGGTWKATSSHVSGVEKTATGGARQQAVVIVPERNRRAYESWGFAPAIKVGDTIHVSGVIVLLAGEGTYEERYARGFVTALGEIEKILVEAGSSLDDVVNITSYHTDIAKQIGIATSARKKAMNPPHPAWTAVGTTGLAIPEGVTELQVEARVSK